jgi:hypothetical protein
MFLKKPSYLDLSASDLGLLLLRGDVDVLGLRSLRVRVEVSSERGGSSREGQRSTVLNSVGLSSEVGGLGNGSTISVVQSLGQVGGLRQVGGSGGSSEISGLLNEGGSGGQGVGVGGDVAGVLDGLLGGLLVAVECLLAVLPCDVTLIVSGLANGDGNDSLGGKEGGSVNRGSSVGAGEDGGTIGGGSLESSVLSGEGGGVSSGEGTRESSVGGESRELLSLEVGGVTLLSRELRSLVGVLIVGELLSHFFLD